MDTVMAPDQGIFGVCGGGDKRAGATAFRIRLVARAF